MVESVNVNKVVDTFTGRTMQGAMRDEVVKYILSGISNGNGSIQIPVLQKMFELFPKFKQDCIDAYHTVFGLNEYVTVIPDDIKAAQGAILDGLCIMYDWNTGRNLGIVTLNNRVIDPSDEDMVDTKVEEKIMECNRIGLIHSYRFDFDYTDYGPEMASVKCVKHRTKVDEENVILVPLIATIAVADIIRSQMNKGKMLAVRIVSGSGEEKHRVITENYEHLSHYCDSAEACVGMTSEYYLLGSFMYAPVLGAPSTTAMKTRIDFLNLETVMGVSNYKQCASFGIQRVKDPVSVLFKEQAILSTMADIRVNRPDEYTRLIAKLPDSYIFNNMLDGDIGTKTLSNYLHTISDTKINALLKSIPGATEAYEKRMSVLSDGQGYVVDAKSLYSELRHHIVKVVWKKANGVYASSICTNCNEILRKVYGEDYFSKYESVGVRISNAVDDIKTLGMPLDVACKTYGFDESVVEKIKGLLKDNNGDYEASFYEAMGKKKRASSSNSNLVTARTLSSYLGKKFDEGESSAKAEDYYISIDTSHLVRAEVVG